MHPGWYNVHMDTTSSELRKFLVDEGADLVGFGDISELAAESRDGYPRAVSVAVKYPKDIIRGISELPTKEYYEWYCKLNDKLDKLVESGAVFIQSKGFKAYAMTRSRVGGGDENLKTPLPLKTAATRAGLGWIGKCALLVTEEYGSMVRFCTILTDAPLETARPVDESRCGDCTVCTDACPGDAVSGKLWKKGMQREEFFDATKCEKAASERTKRGFGGDITICGKCIEICPWTRKYLESP